MQGEPDIFEYDNYHDWLRRWFEVRHEADPSYTAATFLERVNDGPRTLIANVISTRKRAGSSAPERGISLERARRWLPELGLSPDGATYWLLLVEREKVIADVRARDRAWRAVSTDGARRQLEAQWARLVAIEEQRFGLRRFNEPPGVRSVYDTSRPEDLGVAELAQAACSAAVERASDLGYRARTRLQGLAQAIHPGDVPKLLLAVRETLIRFSGRYSPELQTPPEPWDELAEPRPAFRRPTGPVLTYRLHFAHFPVSKAVSPGPMPELPKVDGSPVEWEVYRYTDYRKALVEWMASPLAKGKSQRQIALAAEIDPAMFGRVARFEAHLTEARAADVAAAMGLDAAESRYFTLLAAHPEGGPPDQEITSLRAQADALRLRRATLKLLKDWQMLVLVELTRCGISLRDYARVAECLDPSLTASEVERSISALVETHALLRDAAGELHAPGPSLNFHLWPGNSEEAMYEGHLAMSRLATQKSGHPDWRVLGARFTATADDFPELSAAVRQASATLNAVWTTFTHPPDRVVYLHYVLFPEDP